MSSWTKLDSSIVHSTIWREPHHVRLLWVTMLALADRKGVVSASVPGLADAARITLKECEDALERLGQPDRYSRSKNLDGRRIEPVGGGWRLVNHAKYRMVTNQDAAAEAHRERQRRYRERKKGVTEGDACDVTRRQHDVAPPPPPPPHKNSAARDPCTTTIDPPAPTTYQDECAGLESARAEIANTRSEHPYTVPCIECSHPWRLIRGRHGDFYGHGASGGPTGCRATCPVEEFAARAQERIATAEASRRRAVVEREKARPKCLGCSEPAAPGSDYCTRCKELVCS